MKVKCLQRQEVDKLRLLRDLVGRGLVRVGLSAFVGPTAPSWACAGLTGASHAHATSPTPGFGQVSGSDQAMRPAWPDPN